MIEFWFFLNIFFIVIIVEFFTYIRKNKPFKNTSGNKTNNIGVNSNESKEVLLDDYSTLKDVQIELLPGKLLIKNSDNVFIKIKDRVIIPEVNLLYNIDEKFTLEVINVKGQKINYLYKKI